MFVGVGASRLGRGMLVAVIAVMCHLILTQAGFYQSAARRFFTRQAGATAYGAYAGWHGKGGDGLTYQAAVAFNAKERKDKKESSGTGEDNYFVGTGASGLYVGVADGVGGWAMHGYDSSAISRELCASLQEYAERAAGAPGPKELLRHAWRRVREDGIAKVGGTTAVVAQLRPEGQLRVANLGDSWCGVFRESKLVFETAVQTLAFNTPYQLSIIPDHMQAEATRNGRSYILNTPEDADEYEFMLQKGDIVVLGTDGVTDNVAPEDIGMFIRDHDNMKDLQAATEEFVSEVARLSKDPNFPSIFAQELQKLTGEPHIGGKVDDITVVMVKVD
ncbi:AaceriAGR363Wp [[Ashbya] aceris (nom. inval.)]|nr:AaceriAGR363Wp [[Ashbya] aceris (nom. inval.)]